MTNMQSRFLGSILGLAAGDALGTTVEFRKPGTFKPLTGMQGGGPFGLKPGQWTDDTSMALCLAASLIEKRGFDPLDQMQRYVRWAREGYMSSTGTCFDIGGTVRAALTRFAKTGSPYSGSTDPEKAANGSLMRLAPVTLAYYRNPELAIDLAADSSRTTHGAARPIDACRYMAGLIVGALHGTGKVELLSPCYSPVPGFWDRKPLAPEVAEVADGSFKSKNPPDIKGTGYVVDSLEAALWAFHTTDTFEAGCLAAANLGNDADTTAAIYGQLAGAYYGVEAIPQDWRSKLAMPELLEKTALGLVELSEAV